MDIDQRLAGIEARLTLLEESKDRDPADDESLPVGTPLNGLLWIGRQLWTVEGKDGFWCARVDGDDGNGDRVLVRLDDAGRRRGRRRTKFLRRVDRLSEAITAIVEGWLKGCPDADGKDGE